MELSIGRRHRVLCLLLASVCLVATGCALGMHSERVIVITATFLPGIPESAASATPSPFLQGTPTLASRSTLSPETIQQRSQPYVVQPGDTLTGIAERFAVPAEMIISENNLENPDLLAVGQILHMPNIPEVPGSAFHILPDNRLVRGPGSKTFGISAFVAGQPGYIRDAAEIVDGRFMTADAIITRVALEYSVDPRLLLTLLEFKGSWLTSREISQDSIDYPLGAPPSSAGFDRKGLYRQLTWAADNLNRGYYGWQQSAVTRLQTTDVVGVTLPPMLNPGTVGVQYLLSLTADLETWRWQVSSDGLYATYMRLFGDPFREVVEPVVPLNLVQPDLVLPFPPGQVWYFTGGPHGGWGSGSAWAAVDFAPPDDLTNKATACYVSDYFATAAAAGVIARSSDGSVVLDLDGDGDEATGWTLLYLHIATADRITEGAPARIGDVIGRASCEGGYSTGTHLHIARRYNGEWIPTMCPLCKPEYSRPPLVMGGWSFEGLPGQEYQGAMANGGQRRVAEQGRNIADNQISW